MINLEAIAAAQAIGLSAEATALALADQLVAAKADRSRLRADLARLPGQITAQQQVIVDAQARVTAAGQAREGARAPWAAADSTARTAEAASSAADAAVDFAREALRDLEADPEPGNEGNIQRARKQIGRAHV